MPICIRSQKQFEVSEAERTYCEERGIPLPTISPLERFREMFAFRNETNLFARKCDKTGQDIISIYRPNTPFPVYEREVWLSDDNDPLLYGRPYDFSKSFFQQFAELSQLVPREGKIGANAENSPYVNLCLSVKNCYYTFGCFENEDCMYGVKIYSCKDVVDCMYVMRSQLCYECVNVQECYNLRWAMHSVNCRDSAFLYGCKNCTDCFGCVGLDHKSYCIWNKQYSKEEYEQLMKQFELGSYMAVEKFKGQWRSFIVSTGYVYNSLVNADDCSGQYIENSQKCSNSFFIKGSEDLEDCYGCQRLKDSFSVATAIEGALNYRCLALGLHSYNNQFCQMATKPVDCMYSAYIFNCEKMFGCIGFPRRAAYCILNKQYTKAEYEDLVPRIIAHMKTTGEWGNFFPMSMSDYPYVDTIAQEYFPLAEEDGKKLHVHWQPAKVYPITTTKVQIPDRIDEVEDDFCELVLTDGKIQQSYKLQKKELHFYRKMGIPIPRYAFETRNQKRSKELFQF